MFKRNSNTFKEFLKSEGVPKEIYKTIKDFRKLKEFLNNSKSIEGFSKSECFFQKSNEI